MAPNTLFGKIIASELEYPRRAATPGPTATMYPSRMRWSLESGPTTSFPGGSRKLNSRPPRPVPCAHPDARFMSPTNRANDSGSANDSDTGCVPDVDRVSVTTRKSSSTPISTTSPKCIINCTFPVDPGRAFSRAIYASTTTLVTGVGETMYIMCVVKNTTPPSANCVWLTNACNPVRRTPTASESRHAYASNWPTEPSSEYVTTCRMSIPGWTRGTRTGGGTRLPIAAVFRIPSDVESTKSSTPTAVLVGSPTTPFPRPLKNPDIPPFFDSSIGLVTTPVTPDSTPRPNRRSPVVTPDTASCGRFASRSAARFRAYSSSMVTTESPFDADVASFEVVLNTPCAVFRTSDSPPYARPETNASGPRRSATTGS